MDVTTTFLNGNFEKEIYMDQPLGFVSKGQEDKVCPLKRCTCGIKQSFRVWYFRFNEAIISFGLFMISEDHFVYVKKTTKGIMFLTLYVDDILLGENNMEMIQATKK